jgi:hypothetical protein
LGIEGIESTSAHAIISPIPNRFESKFSGIPIVVPVQLYVRVCIETKHQSAGCVSVRLQSNRLSPITRASTIRVATLLTAILPLRTFHRSYIPKNTPTMALTIGSSLFIFAFIVVMSATIRSSLSSSLKMLDNRACFGAGTVLCSLPRALIR